MNISDTLYSRMQRGTRFDVHKAAKDLALTSSQYRSAIQVLRERGRRQGFIIDADLKFHKATSRWYASHQLIRTR